MNHSSSRRSLAALSAALLLWALLPIGAAAQPFAGQGAYGGRGGLGSGSGPQGSGMMGDPGYGSGPQGYGMMGGFAARPAQEFSLAEANQLLERSARSARIDTARKEVLFSGRRVFIVVAAVQPGFPDTTFEIGGLVDPTIVVPAGAEVTLTLINMDYGPGMSHGIVITDVPPPYPVLGMMGMQDSLAGTPILPPRDRENARSARYPADTVTFTAPSSGTYFYLCQYYDHAAKGMFGRLVVARE